MKKVMILPLVAALVVIMLCGCNLGITDASPLPHPVENDSSHVVNLIQSFSIEEQQIINRFARDIVTYEHIKGYPDVKDVDLLSFAVKQLAYTDVEHGGIGNYEDRITTAAVDDALLRYFGRTITHGTMETASGYLYEYRNGYYYWQAASGYSPPAPLTFVEELYKEENGTYRANYSVYWIDMAISNPDEFYYLSPGECYWEYIPEKYETVVLSQVLSFPELEKQGTGTVILKDYIDSNGTSTYQLVRFPK